MKLLIGIDALAAAGVEGVEIAVAGEHDRIRRDRVRPGLDLAECTRCEPGDGRPLADIDARLVGGAGEAPGIIERVQVARAPIHEAAP